MFHTVNHRIMPSRLDTRLEHAVVKHLRQRRGLGPSAAAALVGLAPPWLRRLSRARSTRRQSANLVFSPVLKKCELEVTTPKRSIAFTWLGGPIRRVPLLSIRRVRRQFPKQVHDSGAPRTTQDFPLRDDARGARA